MNLSTNKRNYDDLSPLFHPWKQGLPLQGLIELQVSLMSIISTESMWSSNIRAEKPCAVHSTKLLSTISSGLLRRHCYSWTCCLGLKHGAQTLFKVSNRWWRPQSLKFQLNLIFKGKWLASGDALTGFQGSVCCYLAVLPVFLQQNKVSIPLSDFLFSWFFFVSVKSLKLNNPEFTSQRIKLKTMSSCTLTHNQITWRLGASCLGKTLNPEAFQNA